VKIKVLTIIILILLWNNNLFCQTNKDEVLVIKDTLKIKKSDDINPLSPAKAAFFSAVLPGLGQIYNKKYWKVPIVYGGLGIAVYFYLDSDTKFQQFRDAYKNRLEGRTNDNLSYLDKDRLISGQKFYERNRDFSSFFIIAVYVLNIVDANVDAHLLQFNVNEKLSFKPNVINNDLNNQKNIAVSFNYTFK
jgi:Family of unknown function (DUF5683)